MPQVEINGEKMYIPQSGMAQFTKDYPEANIHYVVGKETLSIPFKNTESFLKDYPNAIGLGDEQVQPQTATPKAAVAVQTPNERSYQQYEQKQNEIHKTGAPVNFFKTNDKPITFTEGKGFDVPEGYMKRILPGNEVEQANARMKTTIARGVDKTYQNKKSRELETQYAPVIEQHIKEKAQETTKEVDLMEQKYNNLKQNNKTSILDSGNIDWLLTNTKEALNKPSRHEETNIAEDVLNYAKGFGNKITNRDTWTLGMTEIGRSLNTANIFKKLQSGQKLQEDEELLLSAFVTNMAANDLRAEDVSLAYQAGEGTAQSIPYMAEFAILGGASNAVKSGLIKSVTKTMGARSASIVTKWLESNLLKHTLGTAAMTAAMPTTYASMASDYLDKTLAGEEYDLADAGRSFGSSFVENFTERTVGKLLDKGMGAVTNKMIGDKLSGFTKLGKAWNETGILKDIPINSPLGELGEEYVGAGINYGRSFNPLYDDAENEKMRDEASQLFTAEGTKVMVGSILPMTMLPGVFGLYKNQKNKADRETLITNLLQPDISDKVNVHDTNTLVGTQLAFQKSKEAMDNALADLDFTFNPDVVDLEPQDQRAILHDVLAAENLTREQKNAIVEYISNAALQKTIQENRQSQLDEEIQGQREFLQGAVNVETGTLVRGRLKGDESGQTIFITGGLRLKDNENQQAEIDLENSNEAIYYRNEAGEVVPTTADAIEFVGESGVEQEVQLLSEYYQNAYNQQNAEVNAAVQQALLQEKQPAAQSTDFTTIPTEELSAQYESLNAALESGALNEQQMKEASVAVQQIEAELATRANTTTSKTYKPGETSAKGFRVRSIDSEGNYLIEDTAGNLVDRAAPEDMAEFGFRSVAVRPTQAEAVNSNVQNKSKVSEIEKRREDDLITNVNGYASEKNFRPDVAAKYGEMLDYWINRDRTDDVLIEGPETDEDIIKRLKEEKIKWDEINAKYDAEIAALENSQAVNSDMQAEVDRSMAVNGGQSGQAPAQMPQYPLNKKGEIDFDAMTVAQTYEYMVDNYGQEEANNGLSMQEKSIQGLIAQNIKSLTKVTDALYGQLRKATSIQDQVKIREKNKSEITKLTDERTALDTQLAEIRALIPVVEQTPAQPEVMAVKGSNVRPEEQLRREQEAKKVESENPFKDSVFKEKVYHASKHADKIKNNGYDFSKIGSTTDIGAWGEGMYFYTDKNTTINSEYNNFGYNEDLTEYIGDDKNIVENYVDIKNPYDFNENPLGITIEQRGNDPKGVTKKLIENGYDGATFSYPDGSGTEVIVFTPEQIKILKPANVGSTENNVGSSEAEQANLDSANETLTPSLDSSDIEAKKASEKTVDNVDAVDNIAETVVNEEQPVIEVREKEEWKGTPQWTRRLINLGDAMTVEDVVLRRIAGGAKFVWTASAPLKGLAEELGFTNKPGERKLRKNLIDNENGMTPQEFAHVIYESGDLDFMPGVEYQDVYNAVVETLLQVNSATMAMEKAEANRNKYDMMQEDYDIYRSIIPEEWAYLEEIPDEILAGYLGITNFSPEQIDFIFNIQNEYYANEQQQTPANAEPADTSTSERSEAPESTTSSGTDKIEPTAEILAISEKLVNKHPLTTEEQSVYKNADNKRMFNEAVGRIIAAKDEEDEKKQQAKKKAKKSKPETTTPQSQIQQVLDNYNDAENMTMNDVINDILSVAYDNDITAIQEAYKVYQEEVRQDREEFGERGDREQMENDFMKVVEEYMNQSEQPIDAEYKETPEAVEKVDSNVDTPEAIKTKLLSELTLPKYVYDLFNSLKQSESSDYIFAVYGKGFAPFNGRKINEFFSYVRNAINNNDKTAKEILQDKGFDISNVEKVDYTRIWFKNGIFLSKTTGETNSNANYFYAGTQVNIRDTKEYREISDQSVDVNEMIEKPAEATSAPKYKNGDTVYYQGKQYVINGIYNGVLAYDLETAAGKLAFEEVDESELSNQAPAPRSILDVAVEQVKKNEEKAKVKNEIPVSEDGLYQIREVKVKKNDGSIVTMFAVPTANSKGLGDKFNDLFDTIEEAIVGAKENRAEQQRDEERDAAYLEEKRLAAEAKVAKAKANEGKTSKQLMDEARENSVLDKKLNYDGVIMTRRQFIEKSIANGATLQTEQVNVIKDVSRTTWNRMNGREQDDFERRQKEAGKKTEYQIKSEEGYYYTITKIEYDYAQKLLKQSDNSKPTEESKPTTDKVSAAQAEADAALQDFLDAFNDLNSDNLGIVDNTAEKQAKMLVAGTKMVGAYTKLGVYKFADLVQQLQAKGIQITEDLLSAIKKAYGAFAAENDIDELDDMKTVRQFTLNNLQQKKNEDLTPKTDNLPKNDVSLTDQKFIKEHIIFGTIPKTNDNGQPRSTEIIESEAAVSETTSAAITNSASNVGSDKQRAGEVKEQATEQIKSVESLLAEVDNKLANLRLTDKSYSTDGIGADYPINVLAKGEIKKDLTKYIKAVAEITGLAHDTDKKGKTEIVNVNIAPAGGDATFFLWSKTNPEYGVYVSIPYDPDMNSGGWYDNYKVLNEGWRAHILYRVVNKAKKYDGSNQYMPTNVTAQEMAETLLKGINAELKSKGLAEEQVQEIQPAKAETKIKKSTQLPKNNSQSNLLSLFEDEEITPTQNEPERGNQETNSGLGSQKPQEPTGLQPTGVDRSSTTDNGVDGGRSSGISDIPATEGTRNTRNNVIPRGKEYAPSSPKARFDANIEAIKIVRRLIDSGKPATKADQQTLRQFSGWGGLGTYFNNQYSTENKTLREVLTPEEYESAVMSINSAYYTPAVINNALWDVAEKLGFTGGNVLEGSAGIGNIIGSMPRSMSSNTNIEAVEIDEISGNILKYLYPDAKVHIKGFEETNIPNGSVDLAITNVPFVTGLHVYDPIDKDLSKKFKNIHDFCIAKNIRKLKEGGIGIFITSNGTLDKSRELREWIGTTGKTDVIGAFRLNNDTFGGTNVTSDIIIVRKRVANQKHPKAIDVVKSSFVRSGEYATKDQVWDKKARTYVAVKKQTNMEYNDYFKEHPENMGGEMAFAYEKGDTFRPGGVGLYPGKVNQAKQLKQWLETFENIGIEKGESQKQEVAESTEAKEGQLILNAQGQLSLSYRGTAKVLDINSNKVKGETKAQCLKDYNTIKETLQAVLDYQVANESNDGLKPLLNAFNRAYDNFVAKYGQLNKNTTISFLRNDVDFPSIVSIEKYSETKSIDGKVTKNISKTAVFKDRVVSVKTELKPTNTKDAVIASIYTYGAINLPYIAESQNKTEQEIATEIISSKLGFKDPATGSVVVRHEYLSGDVRSKLKLAQASNDKSEYTNNIEELQKVIPMDIPAHLIEFTMGTSWLDKQLYVDYFKEKYNVDATVQHNEGRWIVVPSNRQNETNRAAGVYSEMLGITVYGSDLATAAMNLKPITISEQKKDRFTGKTETITDKDATQAANTRVSEIRDDFKEFVRGKLTENKEQADKMAQEYNDRANSYVPMEIDDTYLPERFEGSTEAINLHAHQKKATIRGTMEPLMLAHEVGAGKTFVLISTAMEMRRLGTANKPMIVVQNATVGQFVSSAKTLYPNAKILTITENDRTPEGRRMFYAKIKYSDWDMIVVPQSTFEMIPDSPEMQKRFIEEKIDEKLHALEALKEENDSANQWTILAMEKEIDELNAELHLILNSGTTDNSKSDNKEAKKTAKTITNTIARVKEQLDRRTDDVQYFDQMGIDALLVDEAHEYKRLGFATSMTRGVKGIDPAGSKKSAGVYLKTRVVLEKSDWKNVVFATGTPISNTAAEIWTFMKYLIPKETLIENEIYYFDDFVRNFGSINQSLEFATNGSYKENTRFSSYINKPELIRLWATVTDTVLSKDIDAVNEKIPLIEGDKATDIFLPQTPSLIDIMRAVKAELKRFEDMSGKEKKANSSIPIVMYGIAKRAAIDTRLVSKIADDEPNSKTNKAVEETLRSLKDSSKYKGTIAIFCDAQNRWDKDEAGKKVKGFDLFEDIKAKLIAKGVAESEIVIIKPGMTVARKEKIFDAVNAGEIRVVLGNTKTLGTGVNMQERLHTLIHMDAPDRPMDYTQRNGRILRQGNLHKEWGIPVRILRFGVEDSLDVTSYQRLKTKSGFIDSIMDGKLALMDPTNPEGRILEEDEEGLFDNPVAVLSGSQYALLKNQAERELRKWESKKKQHEADQIYIQYQVKQNEQFIGWRTEYLKDLEKAKAVIEAKFANGVNTITIAGKAVNGVENYVTDDKVRAKVNEAIKPIAKAINEKTESARENAYFTKEKVFTKLKFNGVEATITTDIERESQWDEKIRMNRIVMHKINRLSIPELGIDYNLGGKSMMQVIEAVYESINLSKINDGIKYAESDIAQYRSDNAAMEARRGKPFAHGEELQAAKAKVVELTELMKQELAAKEEKYKNAGSGNKVDIADVESEEEETDGDAAPQFQAISPIGFYSTVEKALEAIQQEKGSKDQFKAMLLKNGAKQAEMDWMGFDELPEKLTKADIQNWIDENRIEVEEVVLDDSIEKQFVTEEPTVEYAEYTLPGGENYKELLLTMPEKKGDTFKSSHFNEPNILAHIRFDERTVNGERVLFIEEFQSDWAQKGKKEGFKGDATYEPILEKENVWNVGGVKVLYFERGIDGKNYRTINEKSEQVWFKDFSDAVKEANNTVKNVSEKEIFKVPNMPFRKTDQWVNLAVRRMMRYAAENGFDRIAWTNGEQQADRYDLSKSIKEIEYSINPFVVSQKDNLPMYKLKARDKNDNPVIRGEYAENELENIVGKELAKKIINGEGKETVDKTKSLTGLDLKVGGEGMKAFYDAIVPSAMSKLGKPFGAKVESLELSQPRGERSDYEDLGAWEDAYEGTTSTQQSIPVTDSMKETAMAGLPLYHTGTTMQRSTPEEVAETVAQLLKTGLAKEVRMVTPEEIATVDSKAAQMLKTKTGTIYGFVKGGVVYLNSTTPNLNTPIHEFGHLWVDAIEGSELYNRGAELVKGTPYWERVNTDPNYKDLSETARTKEAMAMAIGDKGEAVKRNLGLFASIKVWIADVWTRIGAKFGIQNLTPEQIQNLTFTDFVEVAVSELLTPSPSGIPLKKGKAGAMPATIDVDGVQRPTTNSTGKPIHSTEEGIRNFWRWFGDSKVVDNEGRPLVVYHGTTKNFNSFKDEFKGTNTAHDKDNVGYHFTSDPKYADTYNRIWQSEGYIIFKEMFGYEPAATPFHESSTIPAYLKISKPNIIEPKAINKELIAESTNNNNDGIISTWGGQTEYVAFNSNQIKSATGNNGGFDGSNPDIRYQVEPTKPEFTGDLGKFAQQTTEYNEAQAERTTRISKMQRLQEIMVAKSALAARHRNKEISNQEYAKQMLALHEEKQRVMKGLSTSTSSVTDASTSSTTEIDDPKPVRTTGQSIAEWATQIADWNYRQTIARALAKTASSVTGGLPPVDDDTDINGDMIRAELDQRLGGFFGRMVEGWQDNIRSVRIFQDMLKEKGTRISDFNNFHMQYTAIQGKNDAHLKDFGKRFMEAINANVLNIQKYTNYEYRDLENYVFLKHGIERNEYMRQAAAEEAVNEKLPKLTQEQIDGDIDGSLQDEYKAAYDQFLEEETAKVADKDYSGLFAVAAEIWAKQNGEAFNPKKKGDVARIQKMDEFKAERDAVIVEYIAKFEKTISETIIPTAVKGEQLTINGFWAAINAATHYSLDRLVSSGIESKEEVDDLKARYQYYVPLRGHEVEAEKIWQYEAPDNKNVVSKAIMQASGRGSRAEHPFAYIIQMAQTSINKANRNQLNQTILRLARLDKSGLMSVSETWYVLTGTDPDSGKEIWTETEPDFSEDHEIRAGEIRAWNEKMKKLEEEGKARRFKKGLRIGGLFIKPKQKRQHAITIFEDGESYQVYINGNPRVSQAINELNGTKWNIPIITQTTRFISSMITSRSPQFMLTNGARDLAFASSILPSKEGARYTGQFLKNYPVAMAILANNATFDFGNDKARYKKYLKEFEMNGGETGYSHLLELQDIQKELYKKQKGKNYLNPLTDLDAIISVVDAGNKVIENSTRLAVYIASRESGRSIERSVSDSKEVTLNFNRRGSGIMGAAHVSSIFMFVNAGVQALANFGHVYKMHPVKMSATIGAYAAVGFIMPMIINMIGGDDDEKEYMNMTDWERQTNLCLPTGSGFAKIPLPQEMRVFFKLGDEVYKLYTGRTEASETAMATLLSAADMIPISPLGTIAAGEIGDFGDLQRAISPDALRGVAELATNTNFMGGQIYDKYKADKDELPGYQKARLNRVGEPRAPESIVGFTKWLDNFTGGNDVEKGAVSWNPDIVNHLAKSYLGGMYSLVAEGEKSFTKRFYTSNADIEEKNTTVKDYYKRIREAEEVLRQDKGYWEQVEKGEISEDTYNKAIPPALLEKAYTIHDYGNTITKIERLLKTGDLTPDDELYYKHMSDSLKMEVIRIR